MPWDDGQPSADISMMKASRTTTHSQEIHLRHRLGTQIRPRLRNARGLRREDHRDRRTCSASSGLSNPNSCSTRQTGHITGQVPTSCWTNVQQKISRTCTRSSRGPWLRQSHPGVDRSPGLAGRVRDLASKVGGRSYWIGLGSRRVPRYWAEIDSGQPPGLFPERSSPEAE
jgi:hypothetical protein